MRPIATFEFPPEEDRLYRKARRLEWITIFYLISTAVFVFLTMGSSQAMRTAFFDDLISIVPAAAFLIGNRVAQMGPKEDFPYGRHRATSIAHLAAAIALVTMGAFLFFEAAMKFVMGEKPTIGGFNLFGHMVWGGWPMLAAVVYTGIPSVILGRMKHKLAPKIHDKVLFADASMMKADWMVAAATGAAVIGIGFGYWWVDPLAAALVSADIFHDGLRTVNVAVADLIDREPERTDQKGPEALPDEVRALLEGMDWVEKAEVRFREQGHIFVGEAFVVARAGTEDLVGKLSEAVQEARALDWRMHELVIQPVKELAPTD
jgi:divalent metal cation (Fe/Co/Zn/Cd) transporter